MRREGDSMSDINTLVENEVCLVENTEGIFYPKKNTNIKVAIKEGIIRATMSGSLFSFIFDYVKINVLPSSDGEKLFLDWYGVINDTRKEKVVGP